MSNTIRAAVASWAKTLSFELAADGITVNNILPGFFDTDRLRQGVTSMAKMGNESENIVADRMASSIPAKRFGTPNEFGETCAFLCSKQAAYITGQNIHVNGGLFLS